MRLRCASCGLEFEIELPREGHTYTCLRCFNSGVLRGEVIDIEGDRE